MKNLKQKIGVAAASVGLSAVASADGIGDIGTTMATEIAKAVPVVTSVGMALLSVYVVMKAFRLVSSFMGGK
jgi:putative membrane protein|nr:MAG TPA: coat protein B [Inoviridae sp.]